jgi:23S rRNA G2445 N2-methylase RlmL
MPAKPSLTRQLGHRSDPAQNASNSSAGRASTTYELEVIQGLAEFAEEELYERLDNDIQLLSSPRKDRVRFHWAGNADDLLQLRRSVAVYRIEHFAIPRPKALLGHQHFQRLLGLIEQARALHASGSFGSFHISAAGADSSVFTRIKAKIEEHTGLRYRADVGDLLLAVRRAQPDADAANAAEESWEVAVRLSPRPLSARPWRVCDMPGALNGTVASVMMSLTRPSQQDRVLNLACGSGTLMIERLALGPVEQALGCDVNKAALTCAHQNLAASGYAGAATLLHADAARLPLPTGWATTVCADLPFGMLLGSHESNEAFYPGLLAEAGRLTVREGRLVAITQEVRLFERVLAAHQEQWQITRVIPIQLPASTRAGSIRPRIYLLQRR